MPLCSPKPYVFIRNIFEKIDKNKTVSVSFACFTEIREIHGKLSPVIDQVLRLILALLNRIKNWLNRIGSS